MGRLSLVELGSCVAAVYRSQQHSIYLQHVFPAFFPVKSPLRVRAQLDGTDRVQLQSALDRLVRLLALQLQVEIKRAADRTGSDVSSLLKGQSGLISLLQDFREPKNIDNQSKSVGHLPETPFIIPFSQNPRFVGREVILSQLKDALLKKDENCMPRAVLHGLGGVG